MKMVSQKLQDLIENGKKIANYDSYLVKLESQNRTLKQDNKILRYKNSELLRQFGQVKLMLVDIDKYLHKK